MGESTPFEVVRHRFLALVVGGTVSAVGGLLLAAWVGYEWFVRSTSHEVIALLAGVAVLFGVQLLVFAFMAEMLLALHAEQRVYLDGRDEG